MLIIVTLALTIPYKNYPMETLTALPSYCYEYFKTCDLTKTILVATVGILVIDKFYPIFPRKKQIVQPSPTFDRTEMIEQINSKINEYSEIIAMPTIAGVIERLNDYVSLQTFNEKVSFFEQENNGVQQYLRDHDYKSEIERISIAIEAFTKPPRIQLPLPKDSLEMYEVVGNKDIEFQLKTFRAELAEYQKTANSIQGYLELISEQGKATTPRTYTSDDDNNNSTILGFIAEEEEEEENNEPPFGTLVPPLKLEDLKLNSSASLKVDESNQNSPTSVTPAPNSYSYVHISN